MLTCVTVIGVKNVRLLNPPGTSTPVVTEPGCRLRSGVREQDVPPAGSERGGQDAALSPVLGASFPCRGAGSCCGRWTDGSPGAALGLPGRQVGPQQGCFSSTWALGPCPSSARWPDQGNSQPVLCVDLARGQPSCWAAVGWARPPVPILVSGAGAGEGRAARTAGLRPTMRGAAPCPHVLPPGPVGSPAGQREWSPRRGLALCRAGPQPGTRGAGNRHVGEPTGSRQGCSGGLPRGGSQASRSRD